MKVVIGPLLLMFAVVLNSIGLSSQSERQGPQNSLPHQSASPRPREPRFYYEGHSVRVEEGRPHAYPVINGGILLGIAEFDHFYPLTYSRTSKFVLYNLITRRPIVVKQAERDRLFLGTPFGAAHPAYVSSPSSSNAYSIPFNGGSTRNH